MADAAKSAPSGRPDGQTTFIDTEDWSKQPWRADQYSDMRGVTDFGNLFQFAPFEKGYCFLAVINGPSIAHLYKRDDIVSGTRTYNRLVAFEQLQNAFIRILENEFKGLTGLEDMTAEQMEVANDGINSLSLLGKVSQNHNAQISMSFTEKSGSIITKYVAEYLRIIRDPNSQARTYGGAITANNSLTMPGWQREVFNMLYIITDATCLNVEKAFLILNAQPMNAAYSELYSSNKGDIGTVDLTVNFNAFVTDGTLANKLAHVYMRSLIRTATNPEGSIIIDSYDFDWSISGGGGTVRPIHTSELVLDVNKKSGRADFRSKYKGPSSHFDNANTKTYKFGPKTEYGPKWDPNKEE